jgi:hypothetical protein
MNEKITKLLEKYENQIGLRRNFESYWQSLHDYFYIESPDINATYYPGTELNSSFLYDATTLECADVLASGFMNYLTPPTSKWFRLRHKDPKLSANKEINDYLEDVSQEVAHTLNKSNFYNQVITSYKSSGVYGTSCLLEEEDMNDEVMFYNLPIKQVILIEDARGRVGEYFLEFEYTVRQAAERWGKENLTKEMQEELKGKDSTSKHKFLLYIGKREARLIDRTDKKNLPWQAVWIDLAGKHQIDEGGYNELPIMVHRFDKRPFIPWGFSPAMKALPFARMLNAIAKTNLRAMMKQTDPPLAVPHEAFIMPFNANPRAINYYEKGSVNSPRDIFPFGNYGNPQAGMVALEYYAQQVKSMMYNDVFLAFQGIDKQMNNPEVMERINEKMTMLGPAVGRFTGEVLNPVVIRTIGILFRRGKLPLPPDEILNDPQYEIDYVSQLAQAQKRSELNSLVTALTMTGQMAQYSPEVLDKVSPDRVIDEVWGITGAPIKVLRDDKEIAEIREGRAQAQAEAQQAAIMQSAAGSVKDASTADLNLAKAREVFE